jgi:PAS domain S-box-containing protein
MRNAKILIVEDSATQAAALQALLEREGAEVEAVGSAEQALHLLTESGDPPPDLVLSDIVMPGMSGYDLTTRIKADPLNAHVPVVLLTSLTDPMAIVRGLECGADNYVTKPYDAESLLARIQHVLGQRRLRRDPRASMGVNVTFLGTTFTINSEREQILDLFISSVEDVVRTNHALQASQRELAEAQQQLERYARQMAYRAHVSAEKYSVLMQHASDAIVVLDADDRIAEANARARELLGRELDELHDQPLQEFVRPEDRDALRQRITAADSREPVGQRDIYFTDRAGRTICCEVSASRSAGGDGDLRLVILHDVSERRRAEIEVRRRNQLLHAVIEASPLAIIAVDKSGVTSIWNPAAETLFGWKTDEVLGQMDPVFHAPGGAGLPPIEAEAAGALDGEIRETQTHRRNGDTVDVRMASAALRDDSGAIEGVVTLLEDITEQRRTAAALAEREEQLRQSQKMEAIGRLAGGVAHDFNNMLTAIRGYAHLAMTSLEDPEIRADLDEIDKAAERAGSLTAQLLAFSRKQPAQPRVLDLNSLIEGTEKMLRRLLPESVELRTDFAPDIARILADPGQMEQIVMNLTINSGDAMPRGGTIVLETRMVRRTAEERQGATTVPAGDYVSLVVRDNGEGMNEQTMSKIFEPFFTTKEPGKGTGLGLSTVYGIVQQCGGHALVASTLGQGTTFTILLPRSTEETEQPRAHTAEVRTSTGGERILLVEDNPAVRGVASTSLRRAGYKVTEASDAEAALEIFQRDTTQFDLLISDAVMPGMSGPELIALVVKLRPGLPILLMSGYSETVLTQHGIGDDVSLVSKPFTPSELAKHVREKLDGKRR